MSASQLQHDPSAVEGNAVEGVGKKRPMEDTGMDSSCNKEAHEETTEAKAGMDATTDSDEDEEADNVDKKAVERIRRLEQVNTEFGRSFIGVLEALDGTKADNKTESFALAIGIFDGVIASIIEAGSELDKIAQSLMKQPAATVPVEPEVQVSLAPALAQGAAEPEPEPEPQPKRKYPPTTGWCGTCERELRGEYLPDESESLP